MISGTVKFYNATKGFGFIAQSDGGKDAFVHATALEAAGIMGLAEGQRVTYDLQERRDRKMSAAHHSLVQFAGILDPFGSVDLRSAEHSSCCGCIHG